MRKYITLDDGASASSVAPYTIPTYTTPPPPLRGDMVLPERMTPPEGGYETTQAREWDKGWNACLDEIENLAAAPGAGSGERFLCAEGEVYRESDVEPEIRGEFTPCTRDGTTPEQRG